MTETFVYTGTHDNNFSDPRNWQDGKAPRALTRWQRFSRRVRPFFGLSVAELPEQQIVFSASMSKRIPGENRPEPVDRRPEPTPPPPQPPVAMLNGEDGYQPMCGDAPPGDRLKPPSGGSAVQHANKPS